MTCVKDGIARPSYFPRVSRSQGTYAMGFVMMMAVHSLATTVLMGIGLVAVLGAGLVDGYVFLAVIALAFVAALPVTWIVLRMLGGAVAIRDEGAAPLRRP
ncbi:hypothetical protein [Novosphingobium mangrovi (ex Hu et al. 2023)]|uniref:DUF2798 domain-containing protein n=1 Tax=Novosphingobium mangrovi (ex Hu et al. 2023) TaxID=2930094 RepID=A0ABT0ADA9_9SPHN|nr:hypothetical protein [Novosphingobium mangrovi (ex Hu et al. 2023)]MCJ1961183.1 hypothetical protein [Novosphingobium mangrovi (ex Hu et al. 2023)]